MLILSGVDLLKLTSYKIPQARHYNILHAQVLLHTEL